MKSKTDIRTLSEKELNARLVRDLTEVCPAGEREALAAWRAADPAHEEEYARIRSYWNARVTTTRSIDPEREFRKLQRRIAAGSESRRSGMLRLLATRMGRYASMAAMLAVGLFCGWALSGPRAAERFAFITGSSISSFELPDGSRITLDKESRLAACRLGLFRSREDAGQTIRCRDGRCAGLRAGHDFRCQQPD